MTEKVSKDKRKKIDTDRDNTKEPGLVDAEELQRKLEEKEERIEQLEGNLAAKEEEIKEHIDRIKRIQADFENYKKRIKKEEPEKKSRIENKVLLNIIPIYDNLERAFRNFQKNNDKESCIEGIEKIFSQFDAVLSDMGVEPLEAIGKQFDPEKHEALITAESEEDANTILEVFERGFTRKDRVIKPSRVKVSKKVDSKINNDEQ